MDSQTGKKQNIFTSETQILRYQDMLLGYANDETFGKHSRSVFLQCFPSDSSFAPHATYVEDKICVLEAKNAFEIFQKHFLRPGRIFASQQCLLVCADLKIHLRHASFHYWPANKARADLVAR